MNICHDLSLFGATVCVSEQSIDPLRIKKPRNSYAQSLFLKLYNKPVSFQKVKRIILLGSRSN